jgi:hypothetical protein
MNYYCTILINIIYSKLKNNKKMKNKKVKLIVNPCGKQSSNNQHRGSSRIFTVKEPFHSSTCVAAAWNIIDDCGTDAGWVYEWEMVSAAVTIEELETMLVTAHLEIDDIKSKIKWMKEAGVAEFDEKEHKIWRTLSTLENTELSKIEKVKIIASLIS